MKVTPSIPAATAAARSGDVRPHPKDAGAFGAALAKASTPPAAKPGTDVAATEAGDLKLRKGETVKAVDGHAYADISGGKRAGMFINTSGNARHGEAFVLAHRGGVEYHIYGSGKDRLVVALRPAKEEAPKAEAPAAGDDLDLRKGERVKPVDGHAYSEIVSGARSGMYVNTAGGPRHGETFVLVERGGVNYHVYGSGKDREVVAVKRGD
jgi:hypothetical protein